SRISRSTTSGSEPGRTNVTTSCSPLSAGISSIGIRYHAKSPSSTSARKNIDVAVGRRTGSASGLKDTGLPGGTRAGPKADPVEREIQGRNHEQRAERRCDEPADDRQRERRAKLRGFS